MRNDIWFVVGALIAILFWLVFVAGQGDLVNIYPILNGG
jgi:hypothetical protein